MKNYSWCWCWCWCCCCCCWFGKNISSHNGLWSLNQLSYTVRRDVNWSWLVCWFAFDASATLVLMRYCLLMHQSIQVRRSVLSYARHVSELLVLWLFDDDGQMKWRPSLSLNLSQIIKIFYLAAYINLINNVRKLI